MPSETPQESLCAACNEPEGFWMHDIRCPDDAGYHDFRPRVDVCPNWLRFRRLLNAAYVGGTDHAGS